MVVVVGETVIELPVIVPGDHKYELAPPLVESVVLSPAHIVLFETDDIVSTVALAF